MMMGLAILNPIYFLCMMVGAMKTIQISFCNIRFDIRDQYFIFYHLSGQFYLGGLVGGTIAYFIGELNVN